ncbi:hypothetical protein B0G73_1158 [Paraburkholderia sp. BL25I1N1]|nr:hypothetical protein B0G73_1158 [Paraburkholderia sp. BL25I1N1]
MLPDLLSIPFYDVIQKSALVSLSHRTLTVNLHPLLSVYAGGRPLDATIKLDCTVQLEFGAVGRGGYVLADTTFQLCHGGKDVIRSIDGHHFLPRCR